MLCACLALGAPGARAELYGPSGRHSLDGAWLFRLDGRGIGLKRGFQRKASTRGWSPVTVPNAWNATDQSSASMEGTVAWYRKDFTLPDSGRATWLVRFQSVNNRITAWLNGHPIGTHAGPYLPFEFVLAPALLHRHGPNSLVLRIDSHRRRTDFPGSPYWWNYGGILRRVELVRVDRVGFSSVQVLPYLSCPTCDASVAYKVTLRNYSKAPERVHLTTAYGTLRLDLGRATIAPGALHTFSAALTVPQPHLWSPRSPYLYTVRLRLTYERAPGSWIEIGSYYLRSGVRSVTVSPEGTLLLNGEVVNFRGVGLIEDSRRHGGISSPAADHRFISEMRELGATAIRSQYPLDEELEELADASGILIWSEIPMDSVSERYMVIPGYRASAVAELEQNILNNGNHPSIIVWSIGNELKPLPTPAEGAYITAAAATARAMDPTRLVGLAAAGYPSAPCPSSYYAPLDVLGINDYFGWYSGPRGELANREGLSPFLDEMHACLPTKALVVTEFGAEANRAGPATERGSYAFQQEFVKYHLEVFASKPWLAGACYWALEEFRVRPGWGGGNPKPEPPIHKKGLISFTGYRKPAFYEAQRIYRATVQLHAP